MYCPTCGSLVEDGADFCSACGNALDSIKQEAPEGPVLLQEDTPTAPDAVSPPQPAAKAPANMVASALGSLKEKLNAKPKNKTYLFIAYGAIASFLVVIIIALALLPKGYEKPISKHIKGLLEIDGKTYAATLPEYLLNIIMENNDCNSDEELYRAIEDQLSSQIKYCKDDYGKNLTITYEIYEATKYSERKLDILREDICDEYDLDDVDVKSAYHVVIDITIEGDENDDTDECDYVVAKVEGKWCIVDGYFW